MFLKHVLNKSQSTVNQALKLLSAQLAVLPTSRVPPEAKNRDKKKIKNKNLKKAQSTSGDRDGESNIPVNKVSLRPLHCCTDGSSTFDFSP